MMTPIHKVLAATLLVQAGLSAVTWWPRSDDATSPRPLVELGEVTAIEITGRTTADSAPEPLRLEEADGAWVLPDLDGYPADASKVAELLDQVRGLTVRAPVATRDTSHRALEVADDAFTRRVRLTSGGETVEVLLGVASSQSAHVRRADGDEVFSVSGVSVWSIGDNARRYYDPVYVDVPADEVTSLTVRNAHGAFTVTRGEDGWASPELEAKLDTHEIDDLLRRLLQVRLESPAGREIDPSWGLGEASVAWTTADGSFGYEIGAVVDGKAHVKADGRPHAVRVHDSTVKPALEATVQALVEQPDFFDDEE